ncbi:MAG: glucose-6-phosphate dehydrogenase [Dehalococcoidia bacterium]|nr:glucose-6-phosphate dehydrogenase [Dehalococcoidia bacterium]
MTRQRPVDQDLVLVGGTGDLARRKLLPALYNLGCGGLLPERGVIVAYARSAMSDDAFASLAKAAVAEHSRTGLDESAWPAFAARLRYVAASDGGYAGVREHCALPERLVYLSVPPSAFGSSIRELDRAGLVPGARLVVEKPFGHDLGSSRRLEEAIHAVFGEQQVFRIDHYLGKETVQNVLVFRFGNAVFERVWQRDAIDHIQFTVAETIGIEGRGAFYEETGAIRDILQNHVLQVLSLLTMEPPASFHPEAVRDEKAKLFQAMRPLLPEDVVRGQYVRGMADGEDVPGYREEPGVPSDSTTETFAAARLFIDNWRWAGVPFYLRTGKRLARRTTEVAVVFREAPVAYFGGTAVDRLKPNMLNLSIQPEERISFQFLAKIPGADVRVEPVRMDFCYDEAFRMEPAEAYERLLHDAMDGDHTLFAREDSVDRAWQVVAPVLEAPPDVCFYAAGSWGPRAANDLVQPRLWHPR